MDVELGTSMEYINWIPLPTICFHTINDRLRSINRILAISNSIWIKFFYLACLSRLICLPIAQSRGITANNRNG